MTDPAYQEVRQLAARSTAVALIGDLLAEMCVPLGLDPARVSSSIDWTAAVAAGDLTIGPRGEIRRRQVEHLLRRHLAATHPEPEDRSTDV